MVILCGHHEVSFALVRRVRVIDTAERRIRIWRLTASETAAVKWFITIWLLALAQRGASLQKVGRQMHPRNEGNRGLPGLPGPKSDMGGVGGAAGTTQGVKK